MFFMAVFISVDCSSFFMSYSTNIFKAVAERLSQGLVNRQALAALISSGISAVLMDNDGGYGLVFMWDIASDISLLVWQ